MTVIATPTVHQCVYNVSTTTKILNRECSWIHYVYTYVHVLYSEQSSYINIHFNTCTEWSLGGEIQNIWKFEIICQSWLITHHVEALQCNMECLPLQTAILHQSRHIVGVYGPHNWEHGWCFGSWWGMRIQAWHGLKYTQAMTVEGSTGERLATVFKQCSSIHTNPTQPS